MGARLLGVRDLSTGQRRCNFKALAAGHHEVTQFDLFFGRKEAAASAIIPVGEGTGETDELQHMSLT